MNARLRKSRMAKLLLVCVLFFGMFAYIGMLAGISGQTKREMCIRDSLCTGV